MSAICGIYHADGSPARKELLEAMNEAAAHRGSDGSGVMHKGRVGLGHRLLRTTPESLHEKQPLADEGGRWIVCDGRIDNRTELLDALRNAGTRADKEAPDAELILRAYGAWGAEALDRLLGDYAFAIWDEREETFFCARDPLGIKPFLYHWDGKRFVFGSEFKQIFQDPSIPRDINPAHLGEILMVSFSNREETPYAALRRLPAGYSIRIRRNRFETGRWWRWEPDAEPASTASLEENADAFLEIFREAVKCRLRTLLGTRTGSLLSGGLDSSSVVSVAAGLTTEPGPFPVFNLRFLEDAPALRLKNTDPLDESPYFDSIVHAFGLEPHVLEVGRTGPLERLAENLWIQECPLFLPNLAHFQELFDQAPDAGVRVLLHGEGGDEAFMPGPYCHTREFWRGRFGPFFRECAAKRRASGTPYHGFLVPLVRTLPPVWAKRMLRHFKNPKTKWLRPEFVARAGLRARFQKDFKQNPDFYASSSYGIHSWLRSGIAALYFETFDRAAAAAGIEVRMPFFDLRLLKFMARVPWPQKKSGGTTKVLLRAALKGVLPSAVLNRKRKTEFSPAITAGLKRHADVQMREAFTRPHPALDALVLSGRVRRLHEDFFGRTAGRNWNEMESLWHLWYITAIDQWLKTEPSGRKPREARHAKVGV